jgi:hypothetical protein
MIAVEVNLNGKRLCVAGAEDLGVLSVALNVTGSLGPKTVEGTPLGGQVAPDVQPVEPHLYIGGLTSRGSGVSDDHLRWRDDVSVSIGDVLTIRFLEVEPGAADAPDAIKDSGESVVDASERRMFELAKETYLNLRDKYEDSDI